MFLWTVKEIFCVQTTKLTSPDICTWAAMDEAPQSCQSFVEELTTDDYDDLAIALWVQMTQVAIMADIIRSYGGSRVGESGNINQNFGVAHFYYMKNYFWPTQQFRPEKTQRVPEQSDKVFRWQFRMSSEVSFKVSTAVIYDSEYLRLEPRPDCCDEISITPLVKVIFVVSQLLRNAIWLGRQSLWLFWDNRRALFITFLLLCF